MYDLNDLYYFAQVVEKRGFAAAGRALGMQKSKLSRRISLLEDRLGVRLIQRSSRSFSVTDIGREYYRQCLAMLAGADAAQAVIDASRSEPEGVVRMTCPPGLINYHFGLLIAQFMIRHPRVQVYLKAFNRRVDIIAEGYDLAIRVGASLADQGGLMQRKLGEMSQCLVASPELLNGRSLPIRPGDLHGFPSVAFGTAPDDHSWFLQHGDGPEVRIPFEPRLISDDLAAIREAAIAGVGIAQLPVLFVESDIEAGRLVKVLPQWQLRPEVVCAIFPSRHGLLPSIRTLLDFLAEDCRPYLHGDHHAANGEARSAAGSGS